MRPGHTLNLGGRLVPARDGRPWGWGADFVREVQDGDVCSDCGKSRWAKDDAVLCYREPGVGDAWTLALRCASCARACWEAHEARQESEATATASEGPDTPGGQETAVERAEPTRTCRSCTAPIVWGRTETGAMMPLNATPDPTGNVERYASGMVTVHGAPPMFLTGVLHRPHWADCPDAAEWRRKAATGA